MTDLEITRLCAEAMGYTVIDAVVTHRGGNPLPVNEKTIIVMGRDTPYGPLHDDAQAMALVKKFRLQLTRRGFVDTPIEWEVSAFNLLNGCDGWTTHDNLNRAICECVARMMQSKND